MHPGRWSPSSVPRLVQLTLILSFSLLTGCANRPEVAASWLDRFRSLRPGFSAESVQLEVAVVRQQMGDPYLNDELWNVVDEQKLPLDQKPVLSANGLRVGMMGGSMPAELQTLLTHEPKDAAIRQATHKPGLGATARRLTLKTGQPYFLELGPAERSASLTIASGGKENRLDLQKAQFGLFITPSVSEAGETLLRFEPAVRHGDASLTPKPSADRSDWTLLPTRPEERFPALGWETALSPNEYLIVGGQMRPAGTLGYYCFVQDDMKDPAQWLLVVRTCRPQQVSAHHYSPPDADTKKRSALPLALQSILPSGRKASNEPKVRAKSP